LSDDNAVGFTHLAYLEADGSFSILVERFEDVMSVEARVCFSAAQVITTHNDNKQTGLYHSCKLETIRYI